MKTEKFYKILILEIVVVLAVGAYFFIDSSDIYRWYVGNTDFVKLSKKECDLHKGECKQTLKDGSKIALEILPHTIPLMKPITFRAKTEGIDLDRLEVKVYATNMNMGFHEFSMKRLKRGLYEGSVTLPTCIVGNMIWDANIIVNKPTESVGAIFEFQTDK